MQESKGASQVPFFMSKKPKIPLSVLVVIYTRELDVLLLLRADRADVPYWQSVTGAKDFENESWADTARREVFEETGIDCRTGSSLEHCLSDWRIENVYPIYPQWVHRYAAGITHNTERVFGLEVPVGTVVKINPAEHTAFQWCRPEIASQMCFSGTNAAAINRLI